MLSPRDIRNLKNSFKKKRMGGGYDTPEVDRALTDLAEKWEAVQDERRAAEGRVSELEEKLKHYEKVELALQEALETARDTARRTEEAADRKARLIVEEAELRAQRIIQDAEQERYGLRQDLAALTNRQNEVSARLRGFLMSELEILAQFQGDDPVGFIKLVSPEASGDARALDAGSEPIQLQPLAEGSPIDADAAVSDDAASGDADAASGDAGATASASGDDTPAAEAPEVADPVSVEAPESADAQAETPEAPDSDGIHRVVEAEPVAGTPFAGDEPEPMTLDELETAEPFATPDPEPARPSIPKSPWPDVATPTVPPALWGKTPPDAQTPSADASETEASGDDGPQAPSALRSAPVPGWSSPASGLSASDEPATPADGSGGWSLRSLVTGDGDATEEAPEETPDSIANREQIRRIMEGLD